MWIEADSNDDRVVWWRPVGLSTLSVNIGEETETVEDMYEPYLIQRGFLKRTPRGRIATTLAYTRILAMKIILREL